MSTVHLVDHSAAEIIAGNSAGYVSVCSCGVVILTMSCFSVRLEKAAFEALCGLVKGAEARLKSDADYSNEGEHGSLMLDPPTRLH